MEIKAFSELFPLFNSASPEILEWLLSVAQEQEYAPDEVLLEEDSWGRAVYFVVSGWVKVQRLNRESAIALEILGRGDSFGEMAIIDEPLRSTEAVTLSEVQLISVSAQRFIQMLFKDSQIQHRMLQLTVRRLRQFQSRYLRHHQSSGEKLIKTLIFLAEHYGESTEKGTEILAIAHQDLAQIANVEIAETDKLITKLQNRGWIEINPSERTLCLTNPKQLNHLAGQILA